MALLGQTVVLAIRQALDEGGGPPPGPTGETRAPALYGFMGAFGPLALITVVLRFYTRIRFAKLGCDDITIGVGMMLFTGLIVATVYAIRYGLGVHIWEVRRETEQQMQKCGFASQVLYPPSLGVIKLSILLFFVRVLPPGHKWRKPIYGLAAWVVSSETAFTIALFFQCRPLRFYWDKTIQGTCFDQPKFYYVDAALNLATDLVILSLPWFVFRSLNLSRRRRYELRLVCSFGVFTLISSIIRLPYLYGLNQSKDPTWDVVNIASWSIAELGSAITLASIPAIRPLVAHCFPSWKGSLVGSNSGGTGGSDRAPSSGDASRTKRAPGSSEPWTMASNGSKQAWHEYIELEGHSHVPGNQSLYAESQESILQPSVRDITRVG